MADDLEYEEVHLMGDREHPYQICLPQFNSKIAGYKKINQYFQNAYQEAMKEKEAFFDRLDEEGDEAASGWLRRFVITLFTSERNTLQWKNMKPATGKKFISGYLGNRSPLTDKAERWSPWKSFLVCRNRKRWQG